MKFRVQNQFNFSSDSYAIVFNTSGDGNTPLPVVTSNNYLGYSIAIVVGQTGAGLQAVAYYYYRPPGQTSSSPVLYPIGATPQQLIFTPNSNGLNSEFTIIFARVIADFTVTNGTATPSPTPTASATPTPSSSPSSNPSPSPTASGLVATNWKFNFFVVQNQVTSGESESQLQIIDSLGTGGGNDVSYSSQTLDVSTSFDTNAFYVDAGNHQSIPDALLGGDIANNP